jgi:hypothetical protein
VDLWDFLILLTMQKLTKRKGFNFFRSYYDVYNELETTEDKVAFIDALLDRQFLGIKPTDLKGMAKFAYISQVNSIDSQVKGYEDKTKTILNPTQPPTQGVTTPPTLQVEVKEKVQVEVKDINIEFFNELLISESWIEINAKNNRSTPDKVKNYLKRFNNNLIAQGDKKANKKEFMSHFARWLPLEIAKDIKDKPKPTPLL